MGHAAATRNRVERIDRRLLWSFMFVRVLQTSSLTVAIISTLREWIVFDNGPKTVIRSKSISVWVACTNLKGVSERDMADVPGMVLVDGTTKLTPAVVSSLKKERTANFDIWKVRDLSEITFTNIYADRIYQQIRGDNPKVCI